MNLRKKMFTAFFLFIIFPLVIIGAIAYALMQNIIERNFNDQAELTIKAVGSNVSFIFKEANTYSEYWRFKDHVNHMFDLTWYDAENKITIGKLLNSTFLSFSPVYQVTLINLEGGTVRASKGPATSSLPISFADLQRHPIFADVQKLNGVPQWIGPYEYPEITGSTEMYANIRMMRDPDSMNVKGYLLQNLNLSELDNIFRLFLHNQPAESRFMIFNQEGMILHDSGQELAGSSLFDHVPNENLRLNEGFASKKTNFNGTESMMTIYKFDLGLEGIPDWHLVYITPWAHISEKTMSVLKTVAVIIALCIISALLFNVFFVNRYIRFIIHFVSMMKHVELGNLNIRVPVKGKDETTVLARGFNSLVHRIATLLDEVKTEQQRKNKAELMLLEAQIKPHFIFNTLESINALAIQNEGKKVSQLVYRLGSMLRMFEHQEEIPLAMEMDYLRNYLEIQSYRFENLFTYEIDLPDALKKYFILKLTLQPLVENSIQHGFEGIESGGVISIKVEEHKEQLILWIQDNGCGIPEHVLRRLQYKTSQMNLRRKTVNGERLGLGITNVADRLRIHYGPEYGIMICSDQTGTTIKCAIPKYIPPGDEVGLESVAR